MVRRNSRGAPVDQACGLHAVGYCTGYLVLARWNPPNASGSQPSKYPAAANMSEAICAASCRYP